MRRSRRRGRTAGALRNATPPPHGAQVKRADGAMWLGPGSSWRTHEELPWCAEAGVAPNGQEVVMPGIRNASTRCATLLGVALLMASAAVPAHADVVDRGTFGGSTTGVAEE